MGGARILKTTLWLQRSQMFIDSAARHCLALQRSAMSVVDEYVELYISLRWSEEEAYGLNSL